MEMPYFGIQCDWEEVLASTSGGSCWVSVRKCGQDKSTHGELRRVSPPGANKLEISGSEPFSVLQDKTSGSFLTVKDTHTQMECSYIAAGSALGDVHKSSVISLDVSEGGLGVSISQSNELKIWETETGNVRRMLQGHPIDAYHCRFFPSGIVILTGGADCCVKIWSAETGDCPVTLRGHTGPIQDTCVVERGRNVISVSKDGTARLWDCGESKCLATLFSCKSPINSCTIMTPTDYDLGTPVANMSDREVLTKGKLLVLAREDAKVTGISVAARQEMFTCTLPSSVNRVIQIGTNSFAVGCQSGEIAVFRLNNLLEPLLVISPTKSPILDLLIHPRSQPKTNGSVGHIPCFWASKSDGTCVLINPNSQPNNTPYLKVVQLTGPNCDPVYQIKSDLDFLYTACRDGVIRKYSLKVINRLFN